MRDVERHEDEAEAARRGQTESTPSAYLAELMPGIRQRRGITANAFAGIIKDIGFKFDRGTVSKIENGLRGVSLDEAVGIAAALGVAPVHLFLPRGDDEMVHITPGMAVTAVQARRWFRGEEPLPGGSDRVFRTEVPESEWEERSERLAKAEARVERVRRRRDVSREKLDLITSQLAMSELTFQSKRAKDRLEARYVMVLDQAAEAQVDLDYAEDELRQLRSEEARRGSE